MKIILDAIKARDLLPGDLFIGTGNEYHYQELNDVQYVQAYLRTCQPPYDGQGDEDMLRVTVLSCDDVDLWPRFDSSPDIIDVASRPASSIPAGAVCVAFYAEPFSRFSQLRSVGELVMIRANQLWNGGGKFAGKDQPVVELQLMHPSGAVSKASEVTN